MLLRLDFSQDPHSCALIAAARRGDVLFGMLAIDAGDTINTVNNDEETALHVALENGHQVVRLIAAFFCTIAPAVRLRENESRIMFCSTGFCALAAGARSKPSAT